MSKIIPKFKGSVESGRLTFKMGMKDQFDQYLQGLSGDVEITVKPWSEKNQRSNNQNRYYFGIVLKIISEETGYTVDECHEICKIKFNSKMIHDGKKDMMIGLSTTSLNTSDMESYLEEIRMWASMNLGLNVPEPNEVVCEN